MQKLPFWLALQRTVCQEIEKFNQQQELPTLARHVLQLTYRACGRRSSVAVRQSYKSYTGSPFDKTCTTNRDKGVLSGLASCSCIEKLTSSKENCKPLNTRTSRVSRAYIT